MSVGLPWVLFVAGVAAFVVNALARRHRRVAVLLALAVFAALAAAADVTVSVGRPARVVMLTDVSPSTRGLSFRNHADAWPFASSIAARLAPGGSVEWLEFSDGDVHKFGTSPAEQPTTRTTLPAVDADAIVLQSDGQFNTATVPANVPIFPVITESDPTGDARIISAERDGDRMTVAVVNDGPPRTLTWPDGATSAVPTGSVRLAHVSVAGGVIHLDHVDRWPENDAGAIGPAVATASQRWWIGGGAPAGFRTIDPQNAPALEAWLAARVIILNNVPADVAPSAFQLKLSQYVRELGGGLVLVGGDRAFSAGGYGGTTLDALSPLASNPPTPRSEWLLLIDASGSMAARGEDGRTKLERAVDAADGAAGAIPPADAVAAASFAREVRPWPRRDDHHVVAPSDLVPNGPTNLRAALRGIADPHGASGGPPLHVVLLTDGDADLGDNSALASSLKASSVTVDWLALDASATSGPLAALVAATGGRTIPMGAAAQWRERAAGAVRAATTLPVEPQPIRIRWPGDLSALGETLASQLNRTFGRGEAQSLAVVSDDPTRQAAARWQIGVGKAAAIGFAAPPELVQRVAATVERPPRDPRFDVRWDGEHVRVDAKEAGAAMNGVPMDVAVVGEPTAIAALSQTASGRYEGALPTAAAGRLVTLRVRGEPIDVHAVASLPALEFRKIGVDREALSALADRTGGSVIDRAAVNLPRVVSPRRERSLAVPLLCVAALSLTVALVRRAPRL